MRPRSTIHTDRATGLVHVQRTNSADPIIEAMKGYGDLVMKHNSHKLVGSIDPITAHNWSKEWGCAIGTKEFNQNAIKRLKNDIDYRHFRLGG